MPTWPLFVVVIVAVATVLTLLGCGAVQGVCCYIVFHYGKRQICLGTNAQQGWVEGIKGNGMGKYNKEIWMMCNWKCIVVCTIGEARAGPYTPKLEARVGLREWGAIRCYKPMVEGPGGGTTGADPGFWKGGSEFTIIKIIPINLHVLTLWLNKHGRY